MLGAVVAALHNIPSPVLPHSPTTNRGIKSFPFWQNGPDQSIQIERSKGG